MNDEQILALGNKYRAMHGLYVWRVSVNNRLRTTAGRCHGGRKRIELSGHVMRDWPIAEVIDTILHEIAHALTPNDAGHGDEWRAKCREIGARPDRTYSEDLKVSQRFKARCIGCGAEYEKARRLARAICTSCAYPIEYLDTQNADLGYVRFMGASKETIRGTDEWAMAKCLALGGKVDGGWLDAPTGTVWTNNETHYLDLSLDMYSGRDGRRLLISDIEGGVRFCDCKECSAPIMMGMI